MPDANTAADENAHVSERAALLRDRAEEAVNACGLNPHEWNLSDDVADCEENGLPVSLAEIGIEMLLVVDARITKLLNEEGDEDERAELIQVRGDAHRLLFAVVDATDAPVLWNGRKDFRSRDWLRVQGISAEGRCAGCKGGTAALCVACQQAPLERALRASVVSTKPANDMSERKAV